MAIYLEWTQNKSRKPPGGQQEAYVVIAGQHGCGHEMTKRESGMDDEDTDVWDDLFGKVAVLDKITPAARSTLSQVTHL
jgi:hypothetical protein